MPLPQGILNSALDAIGQTPLIRLDRIARAEDLKCNLLAKAEFLSVGGSVKDRIAKRMVEEAERTGRLTPGQTTVIEATSGNTGIGLGLACALKGYPLIITLPEKMSLEKEATLRALGAEIVRTPTTAAFDSPESHIGVAKRLQQRIPNSVILDQYSNVDNPLAHELTTGPEIIDAIVADAHSMNTRKSSGQVDVVVVGAGTGGTITGISRAIKKAHNPECVVVGVDPKGSILAYPDTLNNAADDASYQVEGIGYDFIPDVLDRMAPTVDVWLKIGDDDAFPAAMRLIKEEALLVGGSSGTALAGALKWLKTEEGRVYAGKEGCNIVVLLPDGIRNYMSKPWFLGAAIKHTETSLSKTIKQAMAPDT